MSVNSRVLNYPNMFLERIFSNIRILHKFYLKMDPFRALYLNVTNYFKYLFSSNQRLKMARYRVYQMKTRLNRMEALIEQSSRSHDPLGKRLNQLR